MRTLLTIGVKALKGAAVLTVAISGINILQKGGGYKGETIRDILGKDPEQATSQDCLRLTKARFMQLFYAAACPELDELKGEYIALNHPGGILAPGVQIYTDNFFGPGKWVGKAFMPLAPGKGHGYNIFQRTGGDGKPVFTRGRRINTSIGKSEYDGMNSYKLNYAEYNGGLVHSMRDELRRINANLYVGLGCMASGGGAINPSLFIVQGPAKEWIGC
jgi:hypothetical protein